MAFKRTFALIMVLTLTVAGTLVAKDKVTKEDPEMLLSQMAQLSLKYQDYPQAVSAYNKLLESYPQSKMAKDYTYYLALAYERSNNFQISAENYQKVVTDYKNVKSAIPGIDSLSLEGVGRCFNKNFKEYAAIINGQPMTKLELDAELEKVPSHYRTQFEGDAGRKKFLDQIIERQLLYAEAQKQGIINNPEIFQRIKDTEQNLLIRGLYDQEVIQKAQPSEKEVRDYYKKNIKEYQTPEQVRASQIVVDNYAQAQKIYQELKSKKGQPFDTLVAKYSIAPNARSNGSLGLINKDQKPSPEPVLFKTAKGKYSKVIPTEPRFAVVKLVKQEGKKLHLNWIVAGTEDEAKKIIAELKAAPDSFGAIAAKRSLDASKDQGGDLGLVTKDQVAPEVFKAASGLKAGKFTTKPVKHFAQYAIYRIDDQIKAGVRDFKQVQAQISGQLQKERQQALYDGLLNRLKEEAKIEYLIEAPEPANMEEKPVEKPEPKGKLQKKAKPRK
ncbi:MAG: peptidylprolyl isomerase [Candidatus Edwardsbacteria bacterium]|nr:peptidylprolyl isomerase [Candidatus Edwardsbacteria bacterium]